MGTPPPPGTDRLRETHDWKYYLTETPMAGSACNFRKLYAEVYVIAFVYAICTLSQPASKWPGDYLKEII